MLSGAVCAPSAIQKVKISGSSFGTRRGEATAPLRSMVNWALGSAFGGLSGILIAPIVGLEPTTMTLLVIPALVVGAMGSFTSFPLVLAGGLFIGILQSEATGYIQTSWVSDAIPLVLVLIVVLIKKDVLGSRISGARKLPRLGSGRVRPISLIVGAGLGIGSFVVAG